MTLGQRWIRLVTTVVVRAPFAHSSGEGDPQADASFTTHQGVVCLVQTADCLPVLFCDRDGTTGDMLSASVAAGRRGCT